MKHYTHIPGFVILLLLSCSTSFCQVENVRIETYYISDADDATDIYGGHLAHGSTTYRIYVDLMPGSKLFGIYGDASHPLIFSSTLPFFNHLEDGTTFGKDLNRTRYENGTVPLDTYITLGQSSKSFAQGAYFGVPKVTDQDGSFIGGENNDGGSEEISSGLLKNNIAEIGIPLTAADGLMLKSIVPVSWIDIGFKDILQDTDTTIFGGLDPDKLEFRSLNALLRTSGITGIDSVSNEILLAQLTTLGEISFAINLEVEIGNYGDKQIVKYVSHNGSLEKDEIFNPLLHYPYTCGCTDPNYLEASTTFACTDNSQCKTLVVLGCMDSLACNYDPDANFNIQDLCCYIGFCHDLDISVACPDLELRFEPDLEHIKLYPNPAIIDIQLSLDFVQHNEIRYTIFDMLGQVNQKGVMAGLEKVIPISTLTPGYYALQLDIDDRLFTLPFVKL